MFTPILSHKIFIDNIGALIEDPGSEKNIGSEESFEFTFCG